MALGNSIIVSPMPRGVDMEGYVNAALLPGTIVQIDVSEGLGDDGRPDWEAFNSSADGVRPIGPLGILLEDRHQGKEVTDAYVSGDRCFVYIPQAGEEYNLLLADLTGTADDHLFGEMLIVNDGDGLLIATTGSPETEPFMLLEAVTDPTGADDLVHVIYTGY